MFSPFRISKSFKPLFNRHAYFSPMSYLHTMWCKLSIIKAIRVRTCFKLTKTEEKKSVFQISCKIHLRWSKAYKLPINQYTVCYVLSIIWTTTQRQNIKQRLQDRNFNFHYKTRANIWIIYDISFLDYNFHVLDNCSVISFLDCSDNTHRYFKLKHEAWGDFKYYLVCFISCIFLWIIEWI